MAAIDEVRRRARQMAEARWGFRWHLLIYVAVNLGLVGVWYYSGQGFPWPLFPIIFWGIGVFSHYYAAYHGSGREWIERETEKILQEEEGKQQP